MTILRSVKKLPSAEDLIRRFPLSERGYGCIRRDRGEIRDILAGRDARLLFIVGPCSAWPDTAVLDYGQRLRALDNQVRDALKLVLRTYIQKPRTSRGWTGPVNQPDPFSPPDIEAGMGYCRRLMIQLVEMGLAIADEALFTHNAKGFAELLAWVAIGARSTEDQEHRIWASACGAPVGLKNPTSGSIPVGVNSVLAAQSPHTAVFDGYQVETSGNPCAHLVLRGGAGGPNYHLDDLYLARKLLQEKRIQNPALLIDTSHDNCRIDGRKDPEAQVDVVREVLSNLRVRPELGATVRGFLLESFLQAGCQDLDALGPETIDRGGLSITDPCLSWERTRELVLDVAEQVRELGSAGRRMRMSS